MTCKSIRQTFKTTLMKRFLELLQEGNGDSLFIGIGRTSPWNNENTPPNAVDSILDETEFWRQCIALKKVRTSDISLVIPRNNWKSGTIFDSFDDDVDLFDDDAPSKFFVFVDEKRIYKCIDNNGGVSSTVKPQETTTTIFKTGDGYSWKFIYQLSEDDSKFVTSNYIPVFTIGQVLNTNDPYQKQFDVQNAAIDGGINFVKVLDAGSAFVQTIDGLSVGTHIIDAGVTSASQYRLSGTEVALVSGVYLNYSLKIVDPDSANYGEIRKITAYNGTTRIATLESNFTDPNDVIGYDFSVIPTIEIVGDGSGVLVEAQMSDLKEIETVAIISSGTGYTYGVASAYGGSTSATTASFNVIISPEGGHGSNAIDELGSASLMISISLDQDEDGLISESSDFRQFSLVSNPKIDGIVVGSIDDTIHSYSVTASTPITEFDSLSTGSSKIIGVGSNQTATFHQYVATIGNALTGTLKLLNPSRKFQQNDVILTANSNFTNGSVTDVIVDRFIGEEDVNNKDVYRQTTRLNISNISDYFDDSTFEEDLTITGSVSGATAIVSSWARTFVTDVGYSVTTGILDVLDVVGGFTTGDTLSMTDADGVTEANLASITSIDTPEIDYHSGQMLYLENIQVLERDNNQKEEIKVILSI